MAARNRRVFRVSPEVLGPLGAEQLQDPALAVLELVKNSWDADASSVAIRVSDSPSGPVVEVEDNGHGMDLRAFSSKWLVIGSSHKRRAKVSEGKKRPLIGEKGLGRLATFALGRRLTIESSHKTGSGFRATIDWAALMESESLDRYEVKTTRLSRSKKGTRMVIEEMNTNWEKAHSEFLLDHLHFLTSAPGERFAVTLEDPWDRRKAESQVPIMEQLSEAYIEAIVSADGSPSVTKCTVGRTGLSRVVFRPMPERERDPGLSGLLITLHFFRRDVASQRLGEILKKNVADGFLEAYQGVRIYLDQINIPPYGLRQDDWAHLEKLRTQTGGPTMTPGNSQVFGEVHLSKQRHPEFVITAGRSGFSSQQPVERLALYVQWVARSLATARRAKELRITRGDVPVRIPPKGSRKGRPTARALRTSLTRAAKKEKVKKDPELRDVVEHSKELLAAFEENQTTLRLYAQLASSGIAATSFAHELRTDFDVVSSAVKRLEKTARLTKRVQELLVESWFSIQSFVSLFQLMPVKIRRQKRDLSDSDLKLTARRVLRLAKSQGVSTKVESDAFRANLISAEVDSILLNLVSNSLKAIKDSNNRNSGLIRVRFEADKSTLVLRVADNGCGVNKAVRKIMFEPLEGAFAEGTGMGLPIVRFIASQYGGSVVCADVSEPRYSTELIVTLNRVVKAI